ncbi:MAG: T9SS type A sorting domain-containing protein [Candidatus Eiseniibacteriota bacterium]
MKRLAAVAAALLPATSFALVNVEWTQSTAGVSIAVDASDNVYTVNYVYNPAGDIFLTKRAADGGLLWVRSFDQTTSSAWEKATWVAADHLGNALVAGTLMSGYSNPVNAASILMKFDPSGQLLWRNVYETTFDGSYTRKCLVDEEGNIYVLGMGSGPAGFVTKVKKFAPDGTALWAWFDADGIGAPINFKFTPDGYLVIAARGIYGSVNGYAKIDRDGNKVWAYPGVNSLTVGDADGDAVGNTYLVHGEYVINGGSTIKKLSPAGALLWSRNYPLAAFRVEVGSDDRAVICGFPNPNVGGASFTKVDADGNVVWANPDADGAYALLLHAQLMMDPDDSIYLAAGTLFEMAVCKVRSDGSPDWTATVTGGYANGFVLGAAGDVYVVGGTTAKLGQAPVSAIAGGEAASASTLLAQSFPNPCSGNATIRYQLPAATHVTLDVYDVAGRVVRELVNGYQGPGQRAVDVDVRGLAAGVYYYRLQCEGVAETKRLTVTR